MVGVINEPASGNTLAVFAANAEKTGNSTTPATVGGGAIVANTNSNSSSSNSTSTSSSWSGGATSVYGSPTTASTWATTASTAPSSPSASSTLPTVHSGAVGMQAVRWSELLGMGVLVAGAALVMH